MLEESFLLRRVLCVECFLLYIHKYSGKSLMRRKAFNPNHILTWYRSPNIFFSLPSFPYGRRQRPSSGESYSSFKLDIMSPFFLSHGDRPSDFITPTRLRSNNYDDWTGDLQLSLQARRKMGFLDGTIIGPVAPYTESDWLIVNAMLVFLDDEYHRPRR